MSYENDLFGDSHQSDNPLDEPRDDHFYDDPGVDPPCDTGPVMTTVRLRPPEDPRSYIHGDTRDDARTYSHLIVPLLAAAANRHHSGVESMSLLPSFNSAVMEIRSNPIFLKLQWFISPARCMVDPYISATQQDALQVGVLSANPGGPFAHYIQQAYNRELAVKAQSVRQIQATTRYFTNVPCP